MTHLTVRYHKSDVVLRSLLADGLDDLRSLELRDIRLGAERAERLAQHLASASLVSLSLERVFAGRGGTAALFARMGELEHLELSVAKLEPDDVVQLLEAAPHATSLGLGFNAALIGHLAPALARMKRSFHALDLRGSYLPDELPALCATHAPHLRSLGLGAPRGRLEPAHAEMVGQMALTKLELADAGLRAEGGQALARGGLRRIRELDLTNNRIGDAGIAALVNSGADRLSTLRLAANTLTEVAVRQLAAWPGLRHVTHLDLSRNPGIGPSGLKALLESPYLDPVCLVLYETVVGSLKHQVTVRNVRERFGDHVDVRM